MRSELAGGRPLTAEQLLATLTALKAPPRTMAALLLVLKTSSSLPTRNSSTFYHSKQYLKRTTTSLSLTVQCPKQCCDLENIFYLKLFSNVSWLQWYVGSPQQNNIVEGGYPHLQKKERKKRFSQESYQPK